LERSAELGSLWNAFRFALGAPDIGLPWITVKRLIMPLPQLPSSTSTVAPFLISSGSCLTTTCAWQAPSAAADRINIPSPVISAFMQTPIRNCRMFRMADTAVRRNKECVAGVIASNEAAGSNHAGNKASARAEISARALVTMAT
jgi:hypothetical protein